MDKLNIIQYFYPRTPSFPIQKECINEESILDKYEYYDNNSFTDENVKKVEEKGEEENNIKEENKAINFAKIKNLNNSNSSSSNFLEYKKPNNAKKQCGRKRMREDDDGKGAHNKFSDDNIRRKCKHLVLKHLLEFINKQLKIIYNGKIGNGIFKKKLQIINQSQKFDATINFNKSFLDKKLYEIFSQDISRRLTNLPPTYNRILIEQLLNEKDETKKIYFQKLFNLNFLQCLKHFRGEYYIDELWGLKCFNQIKDEIKEKYPDDGEEYIQTLEYYLKNYENIIRKKRPRKPRK